MDDPSQTNGGTACREGEGDNSSGHPAAVSWLLSPAVAQPAPTPIAQFGGSGEACHGGDNDDVRMRIAAWVVDPNGVLDLVSEARDPDASRGEQIAAGVFNVAYDFDLPFPHLFGASASRPEGGIRFDSAWCKAVAAADQLGSVLNGRYLGSATR